MISIDKHYTVKEVSQLWSVSPQTVYRLFSNVSGVLKISQSRLPSYSSSRRKPKVILRIPESVLKQVHQDRSKFFPKT